MALSEIEIFDDVEQNSPEWFTLRAGVPTASEFATIIASGKGGTPSKGREAYLYRLAGERMTGEVQEGFTNDHMRRGQAHEDALRRAYALTHDVELRRVGFVRNGKFGCSPDSLIVGSVGGVEIKSTLPRLLIPMLLDGRKICPPEHRAQVQGIMMVAELDFMDIAIGWPGMPQYVAREERNEGYIGMLREECDRFEYDLRKLVQKLESM